ncbi:interferon alpha-inducible protein 27-like protein 2A [Trichechus manatus latirostris]|uniref:Interferon alpha-inducible protein 27-like protein 2A n=1 Tax=Trichechus manatus latirostris TaxID=127582 RepID=A0A2Y9G0A2_TRIMA|nr:interferon alpha-inducible protein 27-like protein 2A [Trichechus manatus latirostris]
MVLSTVGFTGAGIAASSLAAKMMSTAAIANGGGVAAGSLVATLQSVGAAGLSLASKAILVSTGFTFWDLDSALGQAPAFPPHPQRRGPGGPGPASLDDCVPNVATAPPRSK